MLPSLAAEISLFEAPERAAHRQTALDQAPPSAATGASPLTVADYIAASTWIPMSEHQPDENVQVLKYTPSRTGGYVLSVGFNMPLPRCFYLAAEEYWFPLPALHFLPKGQQDDEN